MDEANDCGARLDTCCGPCNCRGGLADSPL